MSRLFVIFVILLGFCAPALAYDWSTNPGDGSYENPYQVSLPDQLAAIGADSTLYNQHFVLTADIVLPAPLAGSSNTINCPVIGSSETPFTGTFNGQGHTISGLHLENCEPDGYIGLFSVVQSTGEHSGIISDVTLADPFIWTVSDRKSAGALIGHLIDGQVVRCAVTDTAGQNRQTDFTVGCFIVPGNGEYARIGVETFLGGLVGLNSGGHVTQCYTDIEVAIINSASFKMNVGGLIGKSSGCIESCYAVGCVGRSGGYPDISYTGGLVGYNDGAIITSYSAVCEKHNEFGIGALAGNAPIGSHFLCCADPSGLTHYTPGGADLKSMSEMMNMSTFRGWGDNVWVLNEGIDMPRLAWQQTAGTPIVDVLPALAGNGTPEDPYRIRSAADLDAMAHYRALLDMHFILANDIFLETPRDGGSNHSAIGTRAVPFAGVFNGNGKTISNLHIEGCTVPFTGLFGAVSGDHACVENLVLNNVYIASATNSVGAVAGYLENGTIRNCTAYSVEIRGDTNVGGLIGWLYSGTAEKCAVTGSVSGINMVGGFVGRTGPGGANIQYLSEDNPLAIWWPNEDPGNDVARVSQCSSRTCVQGRDWIGGFVGVHTWGSVSNSIAETVFLPPAAERTGGFVGACLEGSMLNCYAAAKQGTPGAGVRHAGVVNVNHYSNFAGCYYNQTDGSYRDNVSTALTQIQIKQRASFNGWDFAGVSSDGSEDIWTIIEGLACPSLRWQRSQRGDLAWPDGIGLEDLAAIAQCWLMETDGCSHCDLVPNGRIDLTDFEVLADHWMTARLTLSDPTIVLSALENGPNPAPYSVSVINSSRTDAAFTVSQSDRLTVSPLSSQVDAQQACSLTISLDVTGLAPGIYEESYLIDSPDAYNTPIEGKVIYEVIDRFPVLSLETSYPYFVARQTGPNPDAQTLSISNTGNEDASYRIEYLGTDEGWLMVTPAQGVIAAGQTVQLSLQADVIGSTLSPGDYSQQFRVVCPEDPAAPFTVEVNLDVYAIEYLGFLWCIEPQFTFYIDEGAPCTPQQFTIHNVGYAAVNYHIEYPGGQPAWLSITPVSGTIAAGGANSFSLVVDVVNSGVQPGDYEQIVRICEDNPDAPVLELPITLHHIDITPEIDVWPFDISFTADPLDPTPAAQGITLSNRGGDTSYFTIEFPDGQPAQRNAQNAA